MKKIIVMLAVLVLCLCACGGGKDTELPTEPQSALQNQPDTVETPSTDAGQVAENTEPTEETTPWEAEFHEEDYDVFQFPGQTSYRLGGLFGWEARVVREESDGTIEDTYYYPNYYPCKIIEQKPDGAVWESWLLDNGYEEGGIRYSGTMIYQKQVTPDGTTYETFFDEAGKETRATCANPDGSYRETDYENGAVVRDIFDDPSTGEYSEAEFYENGTVRKSVGSNSQTGMYYEQECYEDGSLKLMINQSPEYTVEERYDEEGFHTYFYSKNADYVIELTADETGALVKVVENGEVKEDAETLAQYAQSYNFRQ